MTRLIDRRDALALLQSAVHDVGVDHALHHRAPARYFTRAGRPLCIVGFALTKLGIEHEALMPFGNFVRCDGVTFAKALAGAGVAMTEDAVRAFRAAQEASDEGAPWGEALEDAYIA